jgi:hypothetical protein
MRYEYVMVKLADWDAALWKKKKPLIWEV